MSSHGKATLRNEDSCWLAEMSADAFIALKGAQGEFLQIKWLITTAYNIKLLNGNIPKLICSGFGK